MSEKEAVPEGGSKKDASLRIQLAKTHQAQRVLQNVTDKVTSFLAELAADPSFSRARREDIKQHMTLMETLNKELQGVLSELRRVLVAQVSSTQLFLDQMKAQEDRPATRPPRALSVPPPHGVAKRPRRDDPPLEEIPLYPLPLNGVEYGKMEAIDLLKQQPKHVRRAWADEWFRDNKVPVTAKSLLQYVKDSLEGRALSSSWGKGRPAYATRNPNYKAPQARMG